MDAGAGEFGGQRLRQRQRAGLADVVGGHARQGAEGCSGGDVDDAAVATNAIAALQGGKP